MVGENIKRIRKEKKITQKQLAVSSGLSVTSIQYYECGKFKPKFEQVERIAEAMNVSPFEIMGAEYWDMTENVQRISNEAAALDSVGSAYGEQSVQLLTDFLSLNEQGRQKAIDYITDLTEQPKYKK